MMKKSIFKKFFCILSLVALLGFSSVPAYAADSIFLNAELSNITPEAGDTVTVTIISGTADTLQHLEVSLSGIPSSILDVQSCKSLISSNNMLSAPTNTVKYDPAKYEVRLVYSDDEDSLALTAGTKLMEVTFQINPNLATGDSIPLYVWYRTAEEDAGTLADIITITYTATATGKGCYVFLNPNGGTLSVDALQTDAEGKISALPTPTREGYTFDGWYTSASGGEKVTTANTFSQDTNLYAHWTVDGTQSNSGSGMGDAVTLGVAGSIISVFVFLLILLVI